jgi:hypothetical protein
MSVNFVVFNINNEIYFVWDSVVEYLIPWILSQGLYNSLMILLSVDDSVG